MTRLTTADFHPQVLELFDRYVHGLLSRRGFLQSASRYTAGVVGAELLLSQLSPNFAQAQQVPPGDPRIQVTPQRFTSPQGTGAVRGILARPAPSHPAAGGALPAVLVVHENRGLNPHIEDIARRLAVEGFIAFAPDALAPLGGYPGDEEQARALFPRLDQTQAKADFAAAAIALKTVPGGNGKVGVVGFCYGGAVANELATRLPDLDAAVPFYGGQPAAQDAARIKAPLQLHFAANDERVNAGWPAYEAALRAARVNYQAHIYPGTQHGFNNDTTPRFDAAAAALAWQRTLDFFNQHLRRS
jgi:carboxymethylenebutenolidase